MLEAIDKASSFIEMVSFIYWTGHIAEQMAEALARKAHSGVPVRLLLDSLGCQPMPERVITEMEEAGVQIRWFRPLFRWQIWRNDHRTHRKLLICDGTIGFTGGVGIAKEWEGDARNPSEWRDTHFCIKGPILPIIRAGFLGNWAEAGGAVYKLATEPTPANDPAGRAEIQVVRSTASVGWSDIATIMHTLIALAQSSINISTAYFVPDETSVDLLCQAARSGVSVKILVPGPHMDHRLCQLAGQREYKPLIDAGVSIRQYQPTMFHVKCISVDGILACIGSANLNHRSLRKDDELCMMVLDEQTVNTLDRQFIDDRNQGREIDLENWVQRSLRKRASERLAKTFRDEL
jgi:cardiolipin synthase